MKQGRTPAGFIRRTAGVKTPRRARGGFQEDVWAGVLMGLRSGWAPGSLRFLVLIGDASAHPPGSPFSTTKLDAVRLRKIADAKRVTIVALHLLSRQGKNDRSAARAQFRKLSKNPGSHSPAYLPIKDADLKTFRRAAASVARALASIVALARQGKTADMGPAAGSGGGDTVRRLITTAGLAAQSRLLAPKGRKRPLKTAYALDRDRRDPAKRVLKPAILITRDQTAALAKALRGVLADRRGGRVSDEKALGRIRDLVTAVIYDPGRVRLVGFGRLTAGLPYGTTVMGLTESRWAAMSEAVRKRVWRDILAKIAGIEAMVKNAGAWRKISPADPPGGGLTALGLETLP